MERYELKKSSDGQYMWNLIAPNNEKILTSERYRTHDGATTGIAACRKNSPHDGRYTRLSSSGRPYFVLKAENHETIGTSELYTSAQGMETGIAACKKYGPTAPVEDLTKSAAGVR